MAERQVVINIPVKDKRELIVKYLRVLYQFHKLPDKEINLLVELVYYYTKYLEKYKDAELAGKLLFDFDTRKLIRSNLNDLADTVFQNYLSSLRRKKIIIGKGLAPQYLPPMQNFNLVIKFYGQQTDKGDSAKAEPTGIEG